jgi:nucleotide-binding universal stress UspA family protein
VTFFHNILVPVDGSEPGRRAADFALKLGGTQARLTFVSAVDVKCIYATTIHSPFSDPSPIVEANQAHAREIIDELVARAKAAHVTANGIVVEGEPAAAVLQTAADLNADLILLSSHGRSGVARMLVGSVAEGIFRRANVPVLIVPSGMGPEHPEKHLHWILSGA